MRQVGGVGTFVLVADIVGDVVAQSAGLTVLRCGSGAIITARVAPVAVTILISVLAVAAGVDALGVIEDKVGVAGETLIL
jgi:pantoate kinase